MSFDFKKSLVFNEIFTLINFSSPVLYYIDYINGLLSKLLLAIRKFEGH